jgi:hypothetical protein
LIRENAARKLRVALIGGRRKKTMRTIAIAAALAFGLAVPVLAAAQANRGGMVGQGAAPVGHRQPTAKDVPRDPANPPVEMTKEDRVLDRALKGICRGC